MPTMMMTGGHAGIGLVTARTLAHRHGCDLILTGRSRERVEAAAATLRRDTGRRIDVVELDLASFASVRAGAAECRRLLKRQAATGQWLGGLLCNAGIQSSGPVAYSRDGYEETFAANCLGHFLLVGLMLDTVEPDGRVVWTTSGTHDPATMDGRSVGRAASPDADSLAHQGRGGAPIAAGRRYVTSKLCIILYAYELDRRLRQAGSGTASIAYDPGFLPDTGMGRMAPAILRTAPARIMLRMLGMTMGQMPFSGEALADLAADPAFADASGRYYQSKDGALRVARSSAASYDQESAAALWAASERLVDQCVLPGPGAVFRQTDRQLPTRSSQRRE